MCVIIHSLKKKHLDRLEVIQAMKHNSSGFFMSHWPHNSKSADDRESIRTLNEDQALEFFDKVPDDDMFVMHARIPSKGIVSLDNVHGWEEDGILFCHNMTITSLNGVMDAEGWKGTDSEYFFRKLFIPMNRGEHLDDPTLKPSEMGPATKRLTAVMCGDSNKFLFVMPDNSVVRAGKWSTIASQKRIMLEEREIDEVVGESVDIEGKVVKKTNKVKKEIEVEREFATVVASNTYYRTTAYTYGGGTTTTRYGATRWNPKTKTFEPIESSSSDKTTTGGYHGTGYGGYGDDSEFYGDDFDDFTRYQHGGSLAKKLEEAREAKESKDSSVATKTKVKKSDISEDDIKKFIEWRKCIPGFKGIDEASDMGTSLLFSQVGVDDGKFDGNDMHIIFDFMLRCLIYNNFRENSDLIITSDSIGFEGSEDEFGLVVTSHDNILDYVIPKEFDDSLSTFVVNAINKLHSRMTVDVSGKDFILPSEALTEMFLEFVGEADYNIGMTAYAESEAKAGDVNSMDKEFFANITAIDNLLNLSFDPTVKANKDVERYARAALVVGRKLRWIPAPLLLAPDRSMLDSTGDWEKSKQQSEFLETLNFIAEACVSGGASLEGEDKRYVAELKNLGFDFDKKGSTEIFLPGFSGQTDDSGDDKDSTVTTTDDAEQDAGKETETPKKEENVLGDPEKANATQTEDKK